MITLGVESIDNMFADGVAGIDVRSRRGPIGSGYWARRWMEFYDSVTDPTEMENGRRLARKSQVYQLEFQPGKLSGIAAEIRQEPFFPFLAVPLLEKTGINAVFDWVVEDAVVTAQLFAGILPVDVLTIVPDELMAPGSGSGGCTCDWDQGPCRHEVALQCVFAEYLDLKPWVMLELIGLPYLELCNHVRHSWGVPPSENTAPNNQATAKKVTHFYGNDADIPKDTALQELSKLDVLERLGPPPFFPAGERNIRQTLTKLYED